MVVAGISRQGTKNTFALSMDYTTLGKSDLRISKIGFGCMSLEGDGDDTVKMLQAPIGNGINIIDTADLYQKRLNEEIL